MPTCWLLQPSPTERFWCGLLAICVLVALVSLPLPLWAYGVAALVYALAMFVAIKTPPINQLGQDQRGWWIGRQAATVQDAQTRQYVVWKAGSYRTPKRLLLRWGWLPWQAVAIRPDAMQEGEAAFRSLCAALYDQR